MKGETKTMDGCFKLAMITTLIAMIILFALANFVLAESQCTSVINQAVEEGSMSSTMSKPRGRGAVVAWVNPYMWIRLSNKGKLVFAGCLATDNKVGIAALVDWVNNDRYLAVYDKGELIDYSIMISEEN